MASNKEIIEQYLRGKGLNDKAIAGVMGNIQQESNFSTTATNSSSGAYGLFQWLGSRKTALQKYATQKGTTTDNIYTQLDFFWQELNTSEKKSLNVLTNSDYNTPSEYAIAFEKSFERSGGSGNANRQKYAESIYKNLSGGTIVTDSIIKTDKNNDVGLKWWGDIVNVVFAILLLVGGVIFIGLAVTSSSTGKDIVKTIKKTKKVEKEG